MVKGINKNANFNIPSFWSKESIKMQTWDIILYLNLSLEMQTLRLIIWRYDHLYSFIGINHVDVLPIFCFCDWGSSIVGCFLFTLIQFFIYQKRKRKSYPTCQVDPSIPSSHVDVSLAYPHWAYGLGNYDLSLFNLEIHKIHEIMVMLTTWLFDISTNLFKGRISEKSISPNIS